MRKRAPTLEDGRVILRAWRAADADDVYAACQDAEIQRWTRVPSPYPFQAAEAFIKASRRAWSDGSAARFAITRPDTGQVVGAVGVNSIGAARQPLSSRLPNELGYWLIPAARGEGLGTHAVRLVVDWAFAHLQLPAVEAGVRCGNAASVRVLQRNGFVPVQTLHATDCVDEDEDLLLFRRPRAGRQGASRLSIARNA
jgi:RimJ/RimL family protein N-acetyltransferase